MDRSADGDGRCGKLSGAARSQTPTPQGSPLSTNPDGKAVNCV
jgi:hypothetical protein